MLKIKEEFLDIQVSCPFTSKIVYLRFLEESLYQLYYNAGYQFIFETIDTNPYTEIEFTEVNPENTNENVIPTNGN